MRSYLDIIIDLKDGKKVDYEEARLGMLMADAMLFFAEKDIEKLSDADLKPFIKELVKKNPEMRIKSRKLSPEEYLGSHHPDNPEQKKFMEIGNKLLAKALKGELPNQQKNKAKSATIDGDAY